MDIREIDEQWLEFPRSLQRKHYIVSISNTGRYRRADGTVGTLSIRQHMRYCNEEEYCYRIIAKHFLITVRRPDQKYLDHITHNPTDYSVNDVRNLRWCTQSENSMFEEAKENRAKSKKSNNVSPQGAYKGAKKLYKAGKLSEEEFQHYRDAWAEDQRERRAIRSRNDSSCQ